MTAAPSCSGLRDARAVVHCCPAICYRSSPTASISASCGPTRISFPLAPPLSRPSRSVSGPSTMMPSTAPSGTRSFRKMRSARCRFRWRGTSNGLTGTLPDIVWPLSSFHDDNWQRVRHQAGSHQSQVDAIDRTTRIAILGAGLAGLTAAGLLLRAGFSVTVYEQSPSFSRIAADIILDANVAQVMHRLGLDHRLATTGISPDALLNRA